MAHGVPPRKSVCFYSPFVHMGLEREKGDGQEMKNGTKTFFIISAGPLAVANNLIHEFRLGTVWYKLVHLHLTLIKITNSLFVLISYAGFYVVCTYI
jgi:hypothetical protein